jgi:predicted MFS family arabinose efflux permease
MVEGSERGAQVLGPGLGGLLIQALRAAPAILVDCASYAVSVASLLWIRGREPAAPKVEERLGFGRELREGLNALLRDSRLRLMAVAVAASNLGSQMVQTVFFVYAYNQIRLSPGQVGGILSVGGLGAVLGALAAPALARRIGLGSALTVSICSLALYLLVPLAAGSGYPFLALALVYFGLTSGGAAYNVNSVSYRQAAVPLRLQGRLTATIRVFVWGTIPVGAFLGGILGSRVGLVPAIYAGGAVAALSVVPLLAGPVRIRQLPEPAD